MVIDILGCRRDMMMKLGLFAHYWNCGKRSVQRWHGGAILDAKAFADVQLLPCSIFFWMFPRHFPCLKSIDTHRCANI